jgi:Sulfatase
VPRPPGIYDRATGRLTTWNFAGDGGYLDNLALADRVIGDLRRGLERALDDRTWIVVSSDHWRRASKRSAGKADHRVPFLVRPPRGAPATHLDAAFNTVATHDLVLAILRGSVRDTRDAGTWLARQTAAMPRDYTGEGRPIYGR